MIEATAAMGAGSLMSGTAALTSTIMGLINGPPKVHNWNYDLWKAGSANRGKMMSSLFYMPQIEGRPVPYNYAGPGKGEYHWSPSESLKNIYSNYLNRNFGMPTSLASSMSAQAMGSAGIKRNILNQFVTPSSVSKYAQSGANNIAKAVIGTQTPEFMRQADYLKNAANLAAFNLWRIKQFGETIG